jgi:hypothetical protein
VSFVSPRRFSECWQISADFPGTITQQMAVREAYALVHGTNKHRLFQRLDHAINATGRSFLIFGFPPDDMFNFDQLAVASRAGINIREGFATSAIPNMALHELGHVVDKLLITNTDRYWFMTAAGIDPNTNTWNHNVQEMFADAVRDCIKGTSWQSLWAILLGTG